MAESKTERVIIPMDRALLDQIEDFRYRERMPFRSQAIRELIRRGLAK
jgi:metal-responsive CopG/Arc/MetJ family transcriptional regulator